MKFFDAFNIREMHIQMMQSLKIAKETIPFIRKHRLWEGMFEHKWILILLVLTSLVFSYSVWSDILQLFGSSNNDFPEIALANMAEDFEGISDAVKSEKQSTVSNGTKYLLLIFLEIIIFYFSAKTVSVITKKESLPTFKDFVEAEKRMIKIMILNFVKGLIAHAVIYTGLAILGRSEWTSFIMFFVYAYFIGYAFLDNYNELFVRTISNSDKIIRYHAGSAIVIGILVSILLYIPLIGPIFAPILGGIAGAIYGNRYHIEGLFLPEDEPEEEYI